MNKLDRQVRDAGFTMTVTFRRDKELPRIVFREGDVVVKKCWGYIEAQGFMDGYWHGHADGLSDGSQARAS